MDYVKIVVGSKNYRLETPPSFADLLARLAKKVCPTPLETYDIAYVDQEQQTVSLTCEDDFRLALRYAARPLRFVLRPLGETDASNEDIFRLYNLCAYVTKIEEEMEAVSTKVLDASPVPAPLVLGPFSSFMTAKDDIPATDATPSLRKDSGRMQDGQSVIEGAVLSFLNLFVVSKIKQFVLDQFRDICAKSASEFAKRDTNSTKSTLAMNLSDISAKSILADQYIPPPDEPPNVCSSGTRPPRLTNLKAMKGRVKRTR